MNERFWQIQQRRLSRRSVLRGTVFGTAGALAASACGKSGESATSRGATGAGAQPKPGGTLTARLSTNPPTLDLHRTTAGSSEEVAGSALSRLLQYRAGADPKISEDHEISPDVALSTETPDAVTWTVKLRPGVRFHNIAPVNGHGLQAEDVQATFKRALDPKNPGRSALGMIDPAAIEIPAPDTIVFKLRYPYALFQNTLASSTYGWILPREALAGAYDPATQVIGTGPFIADTFTPDVAYTLKRNPDWYTQSRPYVDRLQWAIIPDIAQTEAQFTGGHLDVLGSSSAPFPISDLDTVKRNNPRATILRTDPSTAQILYFHLGDPASPFQDVRVRRAFSMAIDRDALAKAVYDNDAERQFYVYLNLGKWALRQQDLPAGTAQYYQHNPAEAKKLLDAAGVTDKQFKFVYVADYISAAYEKMSEAIAAMLRDTGIKLAANQVDYTKDFIGGGKGIRYGFYPSDTVVSAGISVYEDVDTFLFDYYSSKATAGLSHLADAKLDAMFAQARTIVDENQRVKAYLDIQKYLADQMYTVAGLPQGFVSIGVQPRVRDYRQSLGHGVSTESFANLWLAG